MLKNVWKDYVEFYEEYINLCKKHKKGIIFVNIVFIVSLVVGMLLQHVANSIQYNKNIEK